MNPYTGAAIAAIVVIAFGGTYMQGRSDGADKVQAKWDAGTIAIATAEKAAVLKRVADNAKLEAQQTAYNASITKEHDDEINLVRRNLAAERLRRGPGICARPASTPITKSTDIGNAADTAGGAFRGDLDRDIRAAMMQMEEVAATGRACQKFVTDNGMSP